MKHVFDRAQDPDALGVPRLYTQLHLDCPAHLNNLFSCTLDEEHDGPHVAHGTSGGVWAVWDGR